MKKYFAQKTEYNFIEFVYDEETAFGVFKLNHKTRWDTYCLKRFYEILVFGAYIFCESQNPKVLGLGIDCFACYEALKFAEKINLVEKDKDLIRFYAENEIISKISNDSLKNAQVKINYKDPVLWVRECRANKFDMIYIDYPRPTSLELEKYYEDEHLDEIKRVLKKNGIVSIVAGSLRNFIFIRFVYHKLKQFFRNVLPLKVWGHNELIVSMIASDKELMPNFEKLSLIEAQVFDKQTFYAVSMWERDLRMALKEKPDVERVFDAYIYGEAWANYLYS